MKQQSEQSIKLTDRYGNDTEILQLPIDQPNVGLGCRLEQDGSKQHESLFCVQQCPKFHANFKSAALTADETY